MIEGKQRVVKGTKEQSKISIQISKEISDALERIVTENRNFLMNEFDQGANLIMNALLTIVCTTHLAFLAPDFEDAKQLLLHSLMFHFDRAMENIPSDLDM